MTIAAGSLTALLETVFSTYSAIQVRRARLEALQTVPQAEADYRELLADEITTLEALQKEREELRARQRTTGAHRPEDDSEPVVKRTNRTWSSGRSTARKDDSRDRQSDVVDPLARERDLQVRARVKKLIGRWKFTWGIEDGLLALMNRIADDVDRPLGEALALLDWSVFESPAGSHETSEAHRVRIEEWGQALVAYRDRLAGDIETLEIRWRKLLGIWDQWRMRNADEASRRQWAAFIAATRRERREEAEQLRQEIALAMESGTP